jgi:quinol-cytochrome oxidoreductase complex cytochrome b subunit
MLFDWPTEYFSSRPERHKMFTFVVIMSIIVLVVATVVCMERIGKCRNNWANRTWIAGWLISIAGVIFMCIYVWKHYQGANPHYLVVLTVIVTIAMNMFTAINK